MVTALREQSVILEILTFNPDPMEVLEAVGNFGLGVGAAIAEDLSYGVQKTHYNGGMSYQTGKVVGHVFDMVLGAIGTIGGGTFAAATAPTGVGIAAGIGEAIYASSVMVSAGKNLSDDLMNVHFDPGTGGGGGITSGAPEPLGRGSTGRTEPNSLNEQLAMKQAMSNPEAGVKIPSIVMTDKRWPASEGWVKMRQNINKIEIHYVRNQITGEVDDFKFK